MEKNVAFQMFFLDFRREITEKVNPKGKKQMKKVLRPAFGCVQHPKAGRNTQQTFVDPCSTSWEPL